MYKSSSAKIWRKFSERYRLEGVKSAKLLSWSKVHIVPHGYEQFAPYVIAIVELDNGKRMTAQLADLDGEKLSYGMKLKPVFRKYFADGESGVIHYGVKFKAA